MRVFVTGGGGFLGWHVLQGVAARGWIAVAPTSAELDVRDGGATDLAVRMSGCDAVLHLAARMSERDTIVDGSRNVARAAASAGVRFVHLSTDVVFGDRAEAYVESDEPCPAHDYGRSKAAAERQVAAADPTAVMIRTSLMYGTEHLSHAQLDVANAIAGRAPTRFFTDETRCPIFAGDLADAVLALADQHRHIAGPIHITGPDVLTRAEIARQFARHLDLASTQVPTASASELGLAASRPLRVTLDCSRARDLGIVPRSMQDVLGVWEA